MDTNNHYSYSPLSGPRSTRLITLYASKDTKSPLACKLVEIDVDSPPPYQALSYTWDGEIPSEPMAVSDDGDATHRSQSLLVTPNCAAALRLLRRRIKPKDRASEIGLWIDAVCINQSSNDEKSVQVAMMATIYRNARDVVVWLGEKWTPRTRKSLLPTQIIGPFVKTRFIDVWEPILDIFRPLVSQRLETQLYYDLHSYNLTVARAITSLLLRVSPNHVLLNIQQAPYWSRTWTLQEFAHPSATLLCLDAGLCHFRRLKVLTNSIAWHNSHSNMDFHAQCVRCSKSGSSPAPIDFWEGIFDKKATDPRDKVFAMRDLFPNILDEITVDYSRPVKDVFTEATRRVISTTNRLQHLCYSAATPDSKGFPSWAVYWAPDSPWSKLSAWLRLPLKSNSCRGAGPILSFSGDGKTLFLSGKKIGQVGSYVGEQTGDCDEPEASDSSRHPRTTIVPFPKALACMVSAAQETEETLMMARLWGLWDLVLWVLAWYANTRSIASKLKHQKGRAHPGSLLDFLDTNNPAYTYLAMSMYYGRLFFTEEGQAGAGFHTVQSGDSICLFAGVEVPFIVRQKGTGWVLVGSTMLSGAMKGEMWPDNEEELSMWNII